MKRKEDKKNKNIRYVFEKKWNPWMIPVGAISVLIPWLSVKMDTRAFLTDYFARWLGNRLADPGAVLDKMICNMNFLGTAVVTLFSILATFIVFYYSILGYTNYGVSNRKIIGYTVGSMFLPFLVGIDAWSVAWMFIGYYTGNPVLFYLDAVYACVLLGILIVLSVYPTSKARSFNVILKAERKQYKEICDSLAKMNKEGKKLSYILEEERNINRTLYHSGMILGSREPLTDKLRLLRDMFSIPFDSSGQNEENDSKENFKKGLVYKHFYLYHNMAYLMDYATVHPGEAKYVYSGLYENISGLMPKAPIRNDEDIGACADFLIYLGAVFNAMLPVSWKQMRGCEEPDDMTGEIYAFFKYVLNHIIEDGNQDLRALVLLEYLQALTVLWYEKKVDLESVPYLNVAAEFVESINLDDRQAPKKGIEKLREIEYAWLAHTTENVDIYRIMEQTEYDLHGSGEVTAINYLWKIKWDSWGIDEDEMAEEGNMTAYDKEV